MVFSATATPIATPAPTSPPIATLAAITASVAVICELSVARTVTPPASGEPTEPSCEFWI